MENKKTQRNSSIELLRIIAMVGVVILHYNNVGIGGGFKFVNSGTVQEKYLYFSESLFICAVNLFIMISAYFLSTTQKRRFIKVVELVGQVIAFQTAYYLVKVLLGLQEISFSGVVRAILPANYFVILYSVLYLVSPYINVIVKNINREDFKRLVITLFLLFSIWNIGVDFLLNIFVGVNDLCTIGLYGDQAGYTIVNFILVYIIGAYIRLNDISITKKNAVIGIVVCVLLIYLEKVFAYTKNLAWNYNNPIVILLPVFIILLFTKWEFSNKIINELAKAAFTCYLFHMYFMSKLGVEKFVNGNIFVLILHQFGSAIAIYLVSYVVYKIYDTITRPIIKFIAPKCDKINISL